MSKDAAGFDGAFWELYLHEVHLRLGFSIERDPEIPGCRTRPDFLMRRGDAAFFLEATVAGPPATAKQRRQHKIIDLINQAHHPDFGVRLRRLEVGPQQPPGRMIVASDEKWLRTLDRETDIEVRGAHICLSARGPRPRRPRRQQLSDRCQGPAGGGIVNEPPMILDDLRDKASKFGRLEKPYVIAVLWRRDFALEHDVEQALFGPEVMRVALGPDGPMGAPWLDREPRGFWQDDDRKQATRVAAVLGAIHLHPWSLSQVAMRLWRNPWAAVPLETSLPWATTEVDLVTGTYSARRQYRAAGTVWADDPLNFLPHSRQLHLRLLDWRTAPRQRLSSRRPGPPFGCGRSLADAPTRLLRWPGRQPPT